MYPQFENITPSFDFAYIFMSGSKLPKVGKQIDSDPINSIIFLP